MNDFNDGEIVCFIYGDTLQKGIYSKAENIVYGIDFLTGTPKINPEKCCCNYILDVQKLIENKIDSQKYKIQFTHEQEDFICYQIGDWYLKWKSCIANKDGTHRLGIAKEDLKNMICEKQINE